MTNKKLREIQVILKGLRLAIVDTQTLPAPIYIYIGELIDNLVPPKKCKRK